MSILVSQLDLHAAEALRRAEYHRALADDLRAQLRRVAQGGGAEAVKRHTGRGKLLARDRVDRLIDSGTALLELSPLAADGVYAEPVPAAGIVTAIGRVCRREVLIVANDATVKGGTYYPLTVKKHLRAQEIAAENRLPCLYLVDSGGAFLPLQSEVYPDRDHFGRIFYNQAHMSARGIPQIAAVMGYCTAGGAYVPAMSDEVVIVKDEGTIFLGGPPLVKAATGEEVSAEELGGALVHARTSGVADYLAEDDADAIELVREIVEHLGPRPASPWPIAAPVPPRYDPREIPAILPTDLTTHVDVREILARILDDSRLDEFKAEYGVTLVCGFAHVEGHPVGIIANNGVLFSESALKGAHFIEICSQRGIPLVFFQNVAGFMVGRQYEQQGIAKDGAKMVTAVATARVPKLTIILGGSFGAGNYAMAGRAYQPRFLFTWPNSRISVMGGQQAADVLGQIRADRARSTGQPSDPEAERAARQEVVDRYDREGHPYFATARLWDDGVIDPVDTRTVLALALAAASNAPLGDERFGIFRM